MGKVRYSNITLSQGAHRGAELAFSVTDKAHGVSRALESSSLFTHHTKQLTPRTCSTKPWGQAGPEPESSPLGPDLRPIKPPLVPVTPLKPRSQVSREAIQSKDHLRVSFSLSHSFFPGDSGMVLPPVGAKAAGALASLGPAHSCKTRISELPPAPKGFHLHYSSLLPG